MTPLHPRHLKPHIMCQLTSYNKPPNKPHGESLPCPTSSRKGEEMRHRATKPRHHQARHHDPMPSWRRSSYRPPHSAKKESASDRQNSTNLEKGVVQAGVHCALETHTLGSSSNYPRGHHEQTTRRLQGGTTPWCCRRPIQTAGSRISPSDHGG
jgi:hypothetical protein